MRRSIRRGLDTTLVAIALIAVVVGCRSEVERSDTDADRPTRGVVKALGEGEMPMTIPVTSTAFAEEERVPVEYTGDGSDVSPPIAWSDVPEGTRELALICDDPDAPTDEPWVHWVIYKIPGNAIGLPEGIPKQARLKDGVMLQGQNSWSTARSPSIGYRGPAPPKGSGDHRYRFTLYALSGKLVVQPGMTKKQLLAEMQGHILATGRLTGLYSR